MTQAILRRSQDCALPCYSHLDRFQVCTSGGISTVSSVVAGAITAGFTSFVLLALGIETPNDNEAYGSARAGLFILFCPNG
jgi:hypothetical protein